MSCFFRVSMSDDDVFWQLDGFDIHYTFMAISFKVSVALNANIRTKAVIINHD